MTYQITSKSEKGRKKESYEHNGDCCGWIDEKGCVVLALADGVGTCADDARASKTTCDLFLEKCQKALRNNVMLDEGKMEGFCREIDPVLAVDNDMACFCAVVWYAKSDRVVWLHVGDTRIYRYSKKEGLAQMTMDDHGKAVNIKVNGKLYTDHGAVVSAVPIDNAIGDRNCNFHTGSFDFHLGESIVLCSDGMYNSSAFNHDMVTLLNRADLSSGIRSTTTTDDDDASLLVLRNNLSIHDIVGIQEFMDDFNRYQSEMPLNTLIDKFAWELETMLNSNAEVGEIAQLVAFMKAHELYPDTNRIEQLFNSAMNKLRDMPQNEEHECFNAVCVDLKALLAWAYRH